MLLWYSIYTHDNMRLGVEAYLLARRRWWIVPIVCAIKLFVKRISHFWFGVSFLSSIPFLFIVSATIPLLLLYIHVGSSIYVTPCDAIQLVMTVVIKEEEKKKCRDSEEEQIGLKFYLKPSSVIKQLITSLVRFFRDIKCSHPTAVFN